MTNKLNIVLLLVIAICLIKIAFYDSFMNSSKQELKASDNQIKNITTASDVIVWNGYDRTTGNTVPLKVWCVNCNKY